MTTYVDDMRAHLGRMIMCHMIADSDTELLVMVDKIGVHRRWHQYPGTPRSHFDICLTKRELAVKAGAIEISRKELGRILLAPRRRKRLKEK